MVDGLRNKDPIWCEQAGMMGMYSSGYNCHHDVSYHVVDTFDYLVASESCVTIDYDGLVYQVPGLLVPGSLV